MKFIAALFIAFSSTLALVGCQTTPPQSGDSSAGSFRGEVEIVSVRPEKDGDTVLVRDVDGKTYLAVVSIPNLGPTSEFDIAHLQPGNKMIVAGELWDLGGQAQLTVREAEAL